MSALVAVLSKKGENVTRAVVDMIEALELNSEAFGMASANSIKTETSLEALKKEYLESSAAVGWVYSRILPDDEPVLMQLANATMVLDGRIYQSNVKGPEAETTKADAYPEKWATAFVRKTDGDFVFVIIRRETIIAGRDSVGVRPLYYAENRDVAALASECKALWRMGLNDVRSFPPGTVSLTGRKGFKFTVARRIAYTEPKQVTMQIATREVHRLMEHSIKKRTASLNEVPVAFSGGLDSSIIACLAKKAGANVLLIQVSMEKESEVEFAKQAAEALKLPLYLSLHDENNVRETLSKVIRIVEEPDPIKISIGIPICWTAEKTAGMDCHILLGGQGADEFFGGYRRYLDDYLRGNKERTLNAIYKDIVGMHKTNLERDFKICNHFGIELRLPFATYDMARFALNLPLELKMERRDDALRKLVLRQVAKNLGLPHSVVNKPKSAIQYTTGVNKAIKKMAQREGVSMTEYCRKMFNSVFSDFQKQRGRRLQRRDLITRIRLRSHVGE